MLTEEALAYFGSKGKLAKALGITRQAVQSWSGLVPLGRAYQLQELTDGKLRVSGVPKAKRHK